MENGKTPKTKKPIYKRVWFWIVVIVLIFAIKGMGSGKSDDKNTSSKSKETSQSSTNKDETKVTSKSSSVKPKQSSKKLTSQEKAVAGLSGNELAQTKTAISYLYSAQMSKQGLYDQLTSEYGSQMTADEANNAINRIDPLVNWNNLAVLSAKSYRESGNLTGQALLDQLTSEYGARFTQEQAQYGVAHIDDNIKSTDIWN